MRICIVTDAWHPQVNGVVRTLDTLHHKLKAMGHHVYMVTPKFYPTVPCPTYPEIRLSLQARRRTTRLLGRIQADAIHIATEGPIGWAARRWCIKNNHPFTTAYHTAFPEYVAARFPLRADWIYPLFRKFHAASSGVLVATPTVQKLLKSKGFINIVSWTRGVDTGVFYPDITDLGEEGAGPVQLYVGRVAIEKNIEAFLQSNVSGTKVVVGEGPALKKLKKAYPAVTFLGAKFGHELAQIYASADVFVFPSITDTFGLVMIEALACGTPVAAYPVQGPLDVLGQDGRGPFDCWSHQVGALNSDLNVAITEAISLKRQNCSRFAKLYDWDIVAKQFVAALSVRPRDIVFNNAN